MKYIADHPDAKAKEIAEAVGCSIPMAATVLNGESKGSKKKGSTKTGVAKSESTNGNQFSQAIAFVKSMGSIAKAKAALDDLAAVASLK